VLLEGSTGCLRPVFGPCFFIVRREWRRGARSFGVVDMKGSPRVEPWRTSRPLPPSGCTPLRLAVHSWTARDLEASRPRDVSA
jgi:hypothetical protein